MAKFDYKTAAVKTPDELLRELGSRKEGLDSAEAARRLANIGPNNIELHDTRWHQMLAHQFRSSFVYLLLAASIISFVLGEAIDAALILAFIIINTLIGFFQEYKAERALKILGSIVTRTARVIRDGQIQEVNTDTIVPGDIIMLEAGDMIPADGRFIVAKNMTVDESSLTGESVPVEKQINIISAVPLDIFHASSIGFSRTTVMSGDAQLLVCATGRDTEVGTIASVFVKTPEVSGFEKGINRFSIFILKLITVTIIAMVGANIAIHGYDAGIVRLIVFSIALLVGVIPETLPLVTTMAMSRGALRMARRAVVPRRLSAIEDLGSIEVLCTDKTGTITENQHAVADVFGKRDDVLFWALAAASASTGRIAKTHNIFDEALSRAAEKGIEKRLAAIERLNELPFDPNRRRDSALVHIDQKKILVVRGAPEALVSAGAKEEWEKAISWALKEGRKGRRVLAVACSDYADRDNNVLTPKDEEGAELIGLVSFADALKPGAKQALGRAEKLGVRVKIITGDTREVAGWIAHQAGLIDMPDDVMTGEEFELLSIPEQERAAEEYDVFARTTPLQKLTIIQTLQRRHLVGFLGEGFNDAPALKAADVALAIDTASDIARDASDIILLNKGLDVIIDGIREGRVIFANTIKYIKATLTSNFGNFYALAFASLIVDYPPMLPAQILLLNILTDLPMVSIATDSVDNTELRKPRGYSVREVVLAAIVLGLVSTSFDFAFFGFFVRKGEQTLQTMWFIGSVLTELVLLFSVRTALPFFRARRPGIIIGAASIVVGVLAVALPLWEPTAALFSFDYPTASHLYTTFALVAAYFATTEIVKLLYGRLVNNKR